MANAAPPGNLHGPDRLPLVLVALGILVMFVPTLIELARTIWPTDQQSHGPIVLAIAIWLLWKRWPEAMSTTTQPAPLLAWPLIGLALAVYVIGRSQSILFFEMGALIPLLCGLIALLKGPGALRPLAFGLFFLLFVIPQPGALVDAITLPLKIAVSFVAEAVLHAAGYPIARSGVVLHVGQYQLMVADACAGLNTLFTLEALGLLYLNLVKHQSLARNVTLALLIVPISFSANVIRVMTLVLITYHLGDAAGQGFLHGFAGTALFLVGLMLIVAADSLIRTAVRRWEGSHQSSGAAA